MPLRGRIGNDRPRSDSNSISSHWAWKNETDFSGVPSSCDKTSGAWSTGDRSCGRCCVLPSGPSAARVAYPPDPKVIATDKWDA